MERNWKKINERTYGFSVDRKPIGTIAFFPNSLESKAMVKMGEKEWTIKRTGFWKNTIEMVDTAGFRVASIFAEKWYANHYSLVINESRYTLKLRNNPLSEWVILEDGQDLLSYGLNVGDQKETANVKITSSKGNQAFLFDFLLWYLFVPLAIENLGDPLTFLLLLTAQ